MKILGESLQMIHLLRPGLAVGMVWCVFVVGGGGGIVMITDPRTEKDILGLSCVAWTLGSGLFTVLTVNPFFLSPFWDYA